MTLNERPPTPDFRLVRVPQVRRLNLGSLGLLFSSFADAGAWPILSRRFAKGWGRFSLASLF